MKITKPVIFIKQVHACFASCSSSDVMLYIPCNNGDIPFHLETGLKMDGFHPALNGQTIKEIAENSILTQVYVEPDKTFYEIGLIEGMFNHYNDTEQFKTLIRVYKLLGWSTERVEALDKTYHESEYLRKQLRRHEGYVIPEWYQGIPVENFRGALPDSVFEIDELQKYLADGGCFGYIGHSNRTFAIDRELVKVARKNNVSDLELGLFLHYSHARHFADQLDSPTDVEKYFWEYFMDSGVTQKVINL